MERDWGEAGEAGLAAGAEEGVECVAVGGAGELDGEDAAAEGADASGGDEVLREAGLGEELVPSDAGGDQAALDRADEAGLGVDFAREREFAEGAGASEPGAMER